MNKRFIIVLIILALIIAGLWFLFSQKNPETKLILPKQNNMKILSSDFKNNGIIPAKYTCDGKDINPSFTLSQIPENTKSLALIMDDPDAPSGVFVHWILWNIEPKITLLQENSVPQLSTQGKNSAGKNSYFGPCPHSGEHHYHFKVYALDKVLQLNNNSQKSDLEDAMQNHILDFAEIIGLYSKK